MNETPNFFDSLYETLEQDDIDENLCLISGETLLKDHIKLPCSHTFNYIPIFNEVKKQKRAFFGNYKNSNYYEIAKVTKYQIKCPYCRKIHNGLLPQRYILSTGFKTCPDDSDDYPINIFVNFPLSKCLLLNKCSYKFASGKKKNLNCNKKCNYDQCKYHIRILEQRKDKKQKKILENNEKKTNKSCKNPCNHVLTRGPRKGSHCGKKSLEYTITTTRQYCRSHQKHSCMYVEPSQVSNATIITI
jgi:hypothetical protein